MDSSRQHTGDSSRQHTRTLSNTLSGLFNGRTTSADPALLANQQAKARTKSAKKKFADERNALLQTEFTQQYEQFLKAMNLQFLEGNHATAFAILEENPEAQDAFKNLVAAYKVLPKDLGVGAQNYKEYFAGFQSYAMSVGSFQRTHAKFLQRAGITDFTTDPMKAVDLLIGDSTLQEGFFELIDAAVNLPNEPLSDIPEQLKNNLIDFIDTRAILFIDQFNSYYQQFGLMNASLEGYNVQRQDIPNLREQLINFDFSCKAALFFSSCRREENHEAQLTFESILRELQSVLAGKIQERETFETSTPAPQATSVPMTPAPRKFASMVTPAPSASRHRLLSLSEAGKIPAKKQLQYPETPAPSYPGTLSPRRTPPIAAVSAHPDVPLASDVAPISMPPSASPNTRLAFAAFLAAGILMYFFGAALLSYLATFSLLNSAASGLLTFSALELGLGTFLIPSVMLLWKRELFPSTPQAIAAYAATEANAPGTEDMALIRTVRFKSDVIETRLNQSLLNTVHKNKPGF